MPSSEFLADVRGVNLTAGMVDKLLVFEVAVKMLVIAK